MNKHRGSEFKPSDITDKKSVKKRIADIVTRAEIRRVFADAAKQKGKKSAFLMIRHQETGRPE